MFAEDPDQVQELTLQLKWLRHEELNICLPEISSNCDVPHEFLCPITREVMRDPVVCAGETPLMVFSIFALL